MCKSVEASLGHQCPAENTRLQTSQRDDVPETRAGFGESFMVSDVQTYQASRHAGDSNTLDTVQAVRT
jgi:hypothetical protein